MAARALDLYTPEILLPGDHKPKGRLVYNPATPIRKNLCVVYDGWGVVADGIHTPGFRDITGNRSVYVSKNHSSGYVHWKYHKEGIHNLYGGSSTTGECLRSDFTMNNLAWTFGAVFTMTQSRTFGSTRNQYRFICDDTNATAGHATVNYNVLQLQSDTEIKVESNNATFTFTVPDLRDGKQHVAIVRSANISNTSYAQLILDGVVHAEQSASQTPGVASTLAMLAPGSAHHNRGLDGITKMTWYADYRAPVGQCVLESLNPWLTVKPSGPEYLIVGSSAGGPTTVQINLASEADTAFGVSTLKSKAIGQAISTDTAFAMSKKKAADLGLSSTVDSALDMAHKRTLQLAIAAESDTAFAMTTSAATPIGLSEEADSSFALGAAKAKSINISSETDTALAIIHALTRQIGLASEADSAFDFSHALAVAMGLASEIDSALQFLIGAGVQIGLAAETDSALAFGSTKSKQIGQSVEIDSSQVISILRTVALLLASETDSALAMSFSAGLSIGLAQESDSSLAFGSAKALEIGLSTETDTGLSVPPTRLTPVSQAIETDSAFVMDYSRAVSMGIATELDAAFSITPIGALVVRPEGLQYTLPENRLHFTLPANRLHYILRRGH